MKKLINLWSFLCMLLCWVAFIIVSITSIRMVNPHYIIMAAAALVFVFSIMGLGDVKTWRTITRSISSIVGCLLLLFIEVWVLIIGHLLS